MRRRIAAAVGVLALVIGAVAWWALRDGGNKPAKHDPWATPAGPDEAAILARKRAAHGDAPVDTTPASVAGRVLRRSDGSGVAGAVVALELDQPSFEVGGMDAGAAPIVVVADAQGAWLAPDVAAGTYVATAAAPGLVPASQPAIVLAAGARKTGVDLILDAGGATVRGTVTDIGGGPVPDARVSARRGDVIGLKDHAAGAVAITVADGTYQLTLADGDWDATASHVEYTEVKHSFELRGAPLTVDFALTPAAVIHGQVVARADGAPVPGAIVVATGGRTGGGGRRFERDAQSAVADAAGRFTIRGIGSGAIELTATGRGYASNAPTVVQLGIGEDVDGVKVLVDRAYTVSGFVVRKAKPDQGVAGVRVGVFSLGEGEQAMAAQPSGPDGYFEVLGVQPASYLIFAFGAEVMPELGKPVLVKDRDVTDVLVMVDTGATLAGRVSPAASARMSLEVDPDKVGFSNMFEVIKAAMVQGETDKDGRFVLTSAPPGEFTLMALTSDGRVGKLAVTVTAADQTGLVVPLESRASIAGVVIDAAGKPVVGVRVKALPFDDDGGMRMRMSEGDGAVTGAGGAFRVGGLDPGKVSVQVHDDLGPLGWADAEHKAKPHQPIELTLTGSEELTGLTLTVEPRDGVIRGLVLTTDRQPAADAWVTATLIPPAAEGHSITIEVGAGGGGARSSGDDGEEVSAWSMVDAQPPVLTGADGRFVVDHLRRGEYQIVAEGAKGSTRARKSDVKTGESVTLVLEPLGSLAGTVTAGGAPVPDYTISCDGPADDSERHVIAADGGYNFERLPPGKYTCHVVSELGPAVGEATVKGGPARLDLTIGAWSSLAGTVVNARTGAPMPGQKLMAMGPAGASSDIGDILTGGGPTTDAAGKFEIGKQSAGAGNLMVFDGGMSGITPVAHRSYELAPGQRLDLGTIYGVPPRVGPAGTLGMVALADGDVLKVTTVTDGGPAAKAGVKAGDKIVSIDGRAIAVIGAETGSDLIGPSQIAAGQVVALVLQRGGAPVSIAVTADPMPD